MDRRSRSQTRRPGELSIAGGASASTRHSSSSRDPAPLSLPYSRPPDQARTLSPDRRDRYRQSYRDSLPHSNSNSYNQYNQPYPLAPPPPRPQLPTYSTTSPTAVSPSKLGSNVSADKQVNYCPVQRLETISPVWQSNESCKEGSELIIERERERERPHDLARPPRPPAQHPKKEIIYLVPSLLGFTFRLLNLTIMNS